MAQTLEQILGGINRLETIETIKAGLPQVLPRGFMATNERVIGRSVTYDKVLGVRSFAQATQYGAPAREVSRVGRTKAVANAIHSFESMTHDPLILQNLLGNAGLQLQAFATQELLRQTKNFAVRQNNLRTGAVASAFANGKLWTDINGNLLFNSTGATVTIDYGVPANNTGQLNGTLTSGWENATADIVGDIQKVKKLALETTGYPLKYAFYGQNILKYILGNNEAPNLLRGNPALQNQYYTTGEIPDGFCGLEWVPVYNAFGINSSGTVTEFFGGDNITFTPDPDPEWYDLIEGSFLVPNNLGAATPDAVTQAGALSQIYGMSSYAKVTDNPATIQQFSVDTFLPTIKNGSAIFIATVNF